MNSGTKYLLSSIAGAGNTLNAYRPVITSSRGVIPVLAAAGPTSELPLQTIAWQQAATAAFVKRGALKTRGGQLGLAISAASWAALLHMHHVAGRSAEEFERALAEDLGPSYRDAYAGVPLAPADLVLTRLRKAMPRPGRRSQYALKSNVEYGEFGVRNRLDVWSRADLPLDRRVPVLLQIHGGAWIMGSKRGQAYPLMSHLAKQGWVCVAINYRLSPKSDWPASVVDIKRAIAWIRENISEMGGDPEFIAITGGSAGGHLSSLAALTPNVPDFQPGFETADTRVQAAVPLYGVYDFVDERALGVPETHDFIAKNVLKSTLEQDRKRWEQASPLHWVGPDAPPFMIVHGQNDVFARPGQARWFAESLRTKSHSPVVYAELPLAQHGFEAFPSVRAAHTVEAIERFLAFTRVKRAPTL